MLKIVSTKSSNETKVYFKIALGTQGSAKVYSKPLTKDLFNTISKSLKSYRIYLSVQSDKSNNYKQLDYQWLDIQDADKVDDATLEQQINEILNPTKPSKAK